mmetsp:Transcript_2679/g.8403  ORF Transcript_2679/g.8403 Transcript_2679/m.8403 type:complete len:366 (+) Transcript_2679:791-1888(+)
MTNLGIIGTMPDATTLVSLAAQAAAAQQSHQNAVQDCNPGSTLAAPTCSLPSTVPQALLHQTVSFQQQQQSQQVRQSHQRAHHSAQLGTNPAYNAALLQLQAPYPVQQLLQPPLGQLQQAQVLGPASYYSCIPLLRTDHAVANPPWHNIAVATSLGSLGAQSPWILPMPPLATNGAVQSSASISDSTHQAASLHDQLESTAPSVDAHSVEEIACVDIQGSTACEQTHQPSIQPALFTRCSGDMDHRHVVNSSAIPDAASGHAVSLFESASPRRIHASVLNGRENREKLDVTESDENAVLPSVAIPLTMVEPGRSLDPTADRRVGMRIETLGLDVPTSAAILCTQEQGMHAANSSGRTNERRQLSG